MNRTKGPPARPNPLRRIARFFFSRYENADFVTRQRAQVLFAIYACILFLAIPLLTISLTLHTLDPRAFIPPVTAALLISVLIVLFQRGYLGLSAHSFFIISMAGLWVTIFSADYSINLVERTDTIVLILALLTLTPLIVGKRKSAIIAYFIANGMLILLFVNKIHGSQGISDVTVIEYLIDTGMAFIFIGVISFQIFSINKKALDRAREEIRKSTELNLSLIHGEARFRALTENSADLVIILSPAGTCGYVSPSAARFYGYTGEEMLNRPFVEFIHPDERERLLSLLAGMPGPENRPAHVDTVFRHGDGTWRDLEGTMTAMFNTPGVGGVVLNLRDVTEGKKARSQIENSLMEKETLLREIHHRVKNNFQIITSLLNLQARQIGDQSLKDVFMDSQNRIRAMALIHEKLYGSGELAFIDMGAYAETLCGELYQIYQPSPARVRMKTVSDKILMNISQAIPCGLVLNELISNALKHAFPDGFRGEGLIEISLRENGDGSVVMKVRDNGIGMKEKDAGEPDSTLGLYLLTMLAEGQLKGRVQRTVEGGTAYTIHIPPGAPHQER